MTHEPGNTGATTADRRLIERIAIGDASALAELYDAHARTVYTLARRVLGDSTDAEDVVQHVFAQAWNQASRYDSRRATVIGWLVMMTRTRAIDQLRARHARPDSASSVAVPDLPSPEPGQDAALLTCEAVAAVRQALETLDDSLRQPIELAYYEGLTQTAIAERLAQPLGTIKTRMRTALAKLRTALGGEAM